jgi:predicted DNA-binding transcriptional regulator AlpA
VLRVKRTVDARHFLSVDERSGRGNRQVDNRREATLRRKQVTRGTRSGLCRVGEMYRRKTQVDSNAQPDLFGAPVAASQPAQAATSLQAGDAWSEPRPVKLDERDRPPAGDNARQTLRVSSPRTVESRTPHLLDVRAAAAWLGLSKSTLDKMRCYGVGPRFIRATGRAVRYDPADLAAFAEGRRQSRTTDELPA